MTFRLRCLSALFVALAMLTVAAFAQTETVKEPFKVGDTLESLASSRTVYRNIKIRAIGPQSVMISHAGGMASVPLRDLSPELQARFNYDPSVETRATASTSPTPSPSAPLPSLTPSSASPAPSPLTPSAPASKPAPKSPTTSSASRPAKPSAFDALVRRFGQPAEIAPEYSLRSRFIELGLGVRDQGARPSCAVYAIVCALEFQSAQATGKARNFSEDYLIWAARKTTQRVPANAPVNPAPPPSPVTPSPFPSPGSTTSDSDGPEPIRDEGFVLSEVVLALRSYGIALQDQMPNTRGRYSAISTPKPEVIEAAREQRNVSVHPIPGRDAPTLLSNIVHALNAGFPVPIGLEWPHWRTIRSGFLSAQKPLPGAGHAVTLIGYRSASGKIEDLQFFFKNSWGGTWGQGGHGIVTYEYLKNYLREAVVLEVQPAAAPKS